MDSIEFSGIISRLEQALDEGDPRETRQTLHRLRVELEEMDNSEARMEKSLSELRGLEDTLSEGDEHGSGDIAAETVNDIRVAVVTVLWEHLQALELNSSTDLSAIEGRVDRIISDAQASRRAMGELNDELAALEEKAESVGLSQSHREKAEKDRAFIDRYTDSDSGSD